MIKFIKKALFLLVAILTVVALSACMFPAPVSPPSGKDSSGDSQNGDNKNGDNEDSDKEPNENVNDPRAAALIAQLLQEIKAIENGGDYFEALTNVLSHISPEVIENALGDSISGETAELIAEYYDSIMGLTAYLDLFFANIETINTVLSVISLYPFELPVPIFGVSKEKGKPIYYYKTYTFTIVSDKVYRLEESEAELNFLFTEESATGYKIIDEAGKIIYKADYSGKKAFCTAVDYQEETLYSFESVLIKEDFAVQFYDAVAKRLVKVFLDSSALTATVATQNDYADMPIRISEGLPQDFLTTGEIYILDTINFYS